MSRKTLLWAHVTLAVLIAATYILLVQDKSVERPLIGTVTIVLAVLGAAWSTALFYLGVFTDAGRFAQTAKRFFRRQLGRPGLLLISVLVLAGTEAILLRELLFFRGVGISTETRLEAFLNDEVGGNVSLGIIEANDCGPPKTYIRLPVGSHKIAFAKLDGGDVVDGREVAIPPIWKGPVPAINCVLGDDFNALS